MEILIIVLIYLSGVILNLFVLAFINHHWDDDIDPYWSILSWLLPILYFIGAFIVGISFLLDRGCAIAYKWISSKLFH